MTSEELFDLVESQPVGTFFIISLTGDPAAEGHSPIVLRKEQFSWRYHDKEYDWMTIENFGIVGTINNGVSIWSFS